MRVYVLEGLIDYEAGWILGAYASRESAQAALDAYLKDEDCVEFDGYDIHELNVGESAGTCMSRVTSIEPVDA